jgi:hypothetical protein
MSFPLSVYYSLIIYSEKLRRLGLLSNKHTNNKLTKIQVNHGFSKKITLKRPP